MKNSLNRFNDLLNERRSNLSSLILFYSGLIYRYEQTSKSLSSDEEQKLFDEFNLLTDEERQNKLKELKNDFYSLEQWDIEIEFKAKLLTLFEECFAEGMKAQETINELPTPRIKYAKWSEKIQVLWNEYFLKY